MTQEEFTKLIKFSSCKDHCKGGQHVAMVCHYVVGEVEEFDLMVRCGGGRSNFKNKQAVIEALYYMYLLIIKL
jgi:hypothetical protein